MALTPEEIQALLGASRTKGAYTSRLNQFVESGEGGVCANDEWPEFADKQANTIKQGFENAKNGKNAAAGSENVKVITNGEGDAKKVYLINLGAENVGAAAA